MSDPNKFFRYVDGVLKSFTSSSYLSTFGEVPSHPRTGDKLFEGRYENRTFYTASSDDAYRHSSDDGLITSLRGTGSLSGSYNIDL